MTARRLLPGLALAAVLLLAGACASGGDDGEIAGGARDLPETVPEGVTFEEAPEDALPAPPFAVELVDGTRVTAADLWRDRPVVLFFTASWCERCAVLHRDVAGVVDEHPGVALLGVVAEDDSEGARDYAAELGIGSPVAIAPERVWLNYAAREPPVVVLVAPGGKVVRGWPGGVDPPMLDAALDELTASR